MFRVVNLIIVFSRDMQNVLMCHRQKNPYKGLMNFVGGKAYEGEIGLVAAYRELNEETGLTSEDIEIQNLFSTRYMEDELELQVYYGVLKNEVDVIDELNPLEWVSVHESFADDTRFAGNGNIQHMMHLLNEKYKWMK